MQHSILSVLFVSVSVFAVDPIVLTKKGLIRGVSVSYYSKYDMFLGIPYARVNPENPFGHASEIPSFDGIFDANDDSAICPQKDDLDDSIVGTLDCLRLNVFVPEGATSKNKLPVMVWIHGGGFRRWNYNRSSYGPQFLVRLDVILVTMNYRLGPYGFMALNTPEIPGNAGLRDQLMAIEWVKDNIAEFGGDVTSITLFGESAGAASVQFHMLSGHSQDLFHKAIMQSGNILCDWVMRKPDTNSPIKLAKHLGYETDNNEAALNYLSTVNPKSVILTTLELGSWEHFKPSIENSFEGVKTMIRATPSQLLKDANFTIPVIIGFNSRERLQVLKDYLQSKDYFDTSNKTFRAKLGAYFDFDDNELDNAEKVVRHFYIGSESIENSPNEMIDFDSDFTFVHTSLRSSRYHIQSGRSRVYLYMFDYAGERNYLKYRMNLTNEPGAMHADEIGYLFHQSYYTLPSTQYDTMITYRMTTMWTDFAKHSNPTPRSTELLPFTWIHSPKDELQYAVLDEYVNMKSHPFQQRMAFWDAFFQAYGSKVKW